MFFHYKHGIWTYNFSAAYIVIFETKFSPCIYNCFNNVNYFKLLKQKIILFSSFEINLLMYDIMWLKIIQATIISFPISPESCMKNFNPHLFPKKSPFFSIVLRFPINCTWCSLERVKLCIIIEFNSCHHGFLQLVIFNHIFDKYCSTHH